MVIVELIWLPVRIRYAPTTSYSRNMVLRLSLVVHFEVWKAQSNLVLRNFLLRAFSGCYQHGSRTLSPALPFWELEHLNTLFEATVLDSNDSNDGSDMCSKPCAATLASTTTIFEWNFDLKSEPSSVQTPQSAISFSGCILKFCFYLQCIWIWVGLFLFLSMPSRPGLQTQWFIWFMHAYICIYISRTCTSYSTVLGQSTSSWLLIQFKISLSFPLACCSHLTKAPAVQSNRAMRDVQRNRG